MADLTIYFASTGAAAHDCAYSASWNDTSGAAHLVGTTTKGTTSIALRNPYRANGSTKGCGGQWVTAAQSARDWTTSDTFDITIQCKDTAGAGNCTLYLVVNIFNAAGDTLVGTLYDGNVNTVNWTGSHVSRHADGVSVQNNVSCPANGHIVVEIGFTSPYAASFPAQIVVGEGSSGASALPLNDTDTDTNKYPWIAFTYVTPPPSGYTNESVIVFES